MRITLMSEKKERPAIVLVKVSIIPK
jgi:hypothetical protein